MKPLPTPTALQLQAARAPDHFLMIEAGPGTGKTFTAAERFGHLNTKNSNKGVLILSFTSGATSVIEHAIRRRWGKGVLSSTNQVATFDFFFRSILNYLLRSETLSWPGRVLQISPVDEWDHLQPARKYKTAWYPTLDGATVVCRKRSAEPEEYVITAKCRLLLQLEQGLCTHDYIRTIVMEAISNMKTQAEVVDYLSTFASHVLVDEAFDGDKIDIELLKLFEKAGCSISLVGDPWQAIYQFRGADPRTIRTELLKAYPFRTIKLNDCFRFSPKLKPVMERLRSGASFRSASEVQTPNVVLAPGWDTLWRDTKPNIIPLAFGQVRNKLDALMSILLSYCLKNRGMPDACLSGRSHTMLGIDKSLAQDQGAVAFGPILDLLKEPNPKTDEALDLLSLVPKQFFGADRKLPISDSYREKYEPKLLNLAKRVSHNGSLTPGMSIHQAKGEEWDRVTVLLSQQDVKDLGSGLDIDEERHRCLYVGLTRARQEIGILVSRHDRVTR